MNWFSWIEWLLNGAKWEDESPSAMAAEDSTKKGDTVGDRSKSEGSQDALQLERPGISRIFALVVGIDRYKYARANPTYNSFRSQSPLSDITDLRGAVADATSIKEFLTDSLGVPDDHITSLLNEGATRDAIIRAFRALADDNRIQKRDTIVIYYAGHGATAKTPAHWFSRYEIQVLVPHDAKGMYGDLNEFIPDYTIRLLLENLSSKKGNNITVIFDCCHAAGLNRGERQPDGELVRGIDFSDRLTFDDKHKKEILSALAKIDGAASQSTDGSYRGMPSRESILSTAHDSHVLLAACSQDQLAREKSGKGLFTHALLEVLKNADYETCTYSYLIQGVNTIMKGLQSPLCVGKYKNQRLFAGHAKISLPPLYFSVSPRSSKSDREYVIDGAGGLVDIIASRKFAVYTSRSVNTAVADHICTLAVKSPSSTPCIAQIAEEPHGPVTELPPSAIAVPVLDDLTIFVPSKEEFPLIYEAIDECAQYMDRGICSIKPVHEKGSAMLAVELSGDTVAVVILDKEIRDLALNSKKALSIMTIPLVRAKPVSFVPLLRRAVCFFHRLRQLPVKPTLSRPVSVEIFEVEAAIDDDGDTVLQPVAPAESVIAGKQDGRSNLLTPWKVNVEEPRESTAYGIQLRSKSKTSLTIFPSVFYFDCSTLEIRNIYSPPGTAPGAINADGDGALKPNGTLALNYGDGNGELLRFQLAEGQDTEPGFLRIFLTTKPVDLSCMDQEGFYVETETDGLRGMPANDKAKPPPGAEGWWDVITLPICQVRH